MAYTVEELDERIKQIETAWANGIRAVTFRDRSTVYSENYEERLRYFKRLRTELTGGRPRQTRLVASKGL